MFDRTVFLVFYGFPSGFVQRFRQNSSKCSSDRVIGFCSIGPALPPIFEKTNRRDTPEGWVQCFSTTHL
jgi:hypothetical protein